jgi:hypothetical protein
MAPQWDQYNQEKAVRILETEHRLDMVSRLKDQKHELETRIQRINQLLSILEKNPDFEKMLNLSRELL